MKKSKNTQKDLKKEKQDSQDTQKKSLKMGTKEGLQKMREELDWSLQDYLEHSESTPVGNRKKFSPNT